MSDVSIQLVRELFELHAFHVMTYWQHDSVNLRFPEAGLQLLVENTNAVVDRDLDFVLRVGDIANLRRALVEVRAWHGDRFYASVIEAKPGLTQVADAASRDRARQVFGGGDFATIVVISELPASREPRNRAVRRFREAGLDHVVEFPTVLDEMLARISTQISYAPSPTLQTLRLLKRYHFIRRQQLELPFPTEPSYAPPAPPVETLSDPPDAPEESDE